MKTKIVKKIYVPLAAALFISSVPLIHSPKTTAMAYRTEYTIYGDINGDKVIDVFDLVALRKAVNENKYDELYDLNCDEKVDAEDISLLQKFLLGEKIVFKAHSKDDADGDRLCDYLEITKYGTDPDSDDTDKDGLSDFDEIKTYQTDPVNYDSDGDFISDGDELILSLDPCNTSTNGVINDNEVIFNQFISADNELLRDFNANSSADLSINISASGIAEKNLQINKSKYKDVITSDEDEYEAFDLSYNQNLKVDSLRLNFKKELAENDKIDNYMIAKYSPEYNKFLPLDTKYENGDTLYTTINGFSSLPELGAFKVINVKEYAKNFGNTKGHYQRYSMILFEGADSDIYSSSEGFSNDITNKKTIVRDIADFIFSVDHKSFEEKDHNLQLYYLYNENIFTGPDSYPEFYKNGGLESKSVISSSRNSKDVDEVFDMFEEKMTAFAYEPKDHSTGVKIAASWSNSLYSDGKYGHSSKDRVGNYCFALLNRVPEVDESYYEYIKERGLHIYFIVPKDKITGSDAEELAENYGNKIYSYDNYRLAFADILTEK